MRKNAARLYCEISTSLAGRLAGYSAMSGVPKTTIVERALDAYLALAEAGQTVGAPVVPVPGRAEPTKKEEIE